MVTADESQPASTDAHNETITSVQLHADSDLKTLLPLLRLPPEFLTSIEKLLTGECSSLPGDAFDLSVALSNQLHGALLETSKSCHKLACPLIHNLCNIVNNSGSSENSSSSTAVEFCAAVLLSVVPSIVVASFLYGSASRSLLEGHNVGTGFTAHSAPPQNAISASVPPSPTANASFTSAPYQSSPSASIRQVLSSVSTSSARFPSHSHHGHSSPEFILQYILFLIANGSLVTHSSTLLGQQQQQLMQSQQPAVTSQTQTGNRLTAHSMSASSLRPASASGRAASPSSPPTLMPSPSYQVVHQGPTLPAIHHFASMVAPSVYHNPVLFGVSVVADNAQTEHHQRERKVRIQTPLASALINSILSNFNPSATNMSAIAPGLVASLAVAALAEFNRHHAIQLSSATSNVSGIVRNCDAALRLLALPVSSPSLQAVSSYLVLQFVYFVSIASAGTSRVTSGNSGASSDMPSESANAPSSSSAPTKPCRKCSISSDSPKSRPKTKAVGVSFDVDEVGDGDGDSSTEEEVGSDDGQLCRYKLLQVLHAARNLAELRLWPDVLAVVKAVKNTSGLAIDLGYGSDIGVVELAQPSSVRAITNASFKAKKLADDIEVTVDQREPLSSPAQQKRVHGHRNEPGIAPDSNVTSSGSKRSSGHHHHHHTSNQFASHWKAGKHAAAIASLQAAFRLPERLRSRRRSFGHDLHSSSGSSLQHANSSLGGVSGQSHTLTPTPPASSNRAAAMALNQPGIVAASSFSYMDRESSAGMPTGPRLEMRILDSAQPSSPGLDIDAIEIETTMDDKHLDLPMIDDSRNNNNNVTPSTDNTPRSRTNSSGQRPAALSSALSAITRTSRS